MSEKKKIGFAALSPERRTEVSKLGGAAVPAEKRAWARDIELARAAGRKGGLASKRGPAKSPRGKRVKPEQF